MVLLEDGRPLIDGGTIQYDPFYGQPKVSVFEPATNTFSDIQSMAHGRWYPMVLTLGDALVMAFSGLNETGGTNSTIEFYTIGAGWSTSRPVGPPISTPLASAAQRESLLFRCTDHIEAF